jgi:hypothetical protein
MRNGTQPGRWHNICATCRVMCHLSGYFSFLISARTFLVSRKPVQVLTVLPSLSIRIAAGWPATPKYSQLSPVESQYMRTVFTLLRLTKSFACFRSSCVPMPTTLTVFALVRANCSSAGASRLQALQCGAQNHASVATFPPLLDARSTVLLVFRSVT